MIPALRARFNASWTEAQYQAMLAGLKEQSQGTIQFPVAETPCFFPRPLIGGVGVIYVLGMQGFILALVGEYLGRIQREVEGRPLYSIERELP